jgi:HSP20 family protein
MAEVAVAAPKDAAKTSAPAPRQDPFHSLRNEMDRLFDRFAAGFRMPSWRGVFDIEPAWRSFDFTAPVVDVIEDDKAYKIMAEMPGLEEKDIEISISGDMLTLRGEKREEKKEQDKNRYLSERTYGSFQRCFSLPDTVDRDKVEADLRKGVLTITLGKKAEAQRPEKKIEIKAAA